MFDNVIESPQLLKPSSKDRSGRMSRIQMKSFSRPALPFDLPPSLKDDKVKSVDVESATQPIKQHPQ